MVDYDSYAHRTSRRQLDSRRDEILQKLGYKILRIDNEGVRLGPDVRAYRLAKTLGELPIPKTDAAFSWLRITRSAVLAGIRVSCSLEGLRLFLGETINSEIVRGYLAGGRDRLVERKRTRGSAIEVEAEWKKKLATHQGYTLITCSNIKQVSYRDEYGSSIRWLPDSGVTGSLAGDAGIEALLALRRTGIFKTSIIVDLSYRKNEKR